MNISFSAHFVNRKRIRGIPDGLAETVFWEADERFRDALTGMFIAVKHVPIAGKNRDLALTYTIKKQYSDICHNSSTEAGPDGKPC